MYTIRWKWNKLTKKERYQVALDWFRANMPVAQSELDHQNPFQLLVAVVLSAQCTDKRVNQVTPALFQAYPNAAAMASATVSDILTYIQSVSYPNNKAKHLVGLAQKLQQDFQGEVPASVDLLQTLPGVGRKTANVVMAVAFDKPAMPVDTHVFRVSHRLGLVPKTAQTPLQVEKELTKHIPYNEWGVAHHWLLLHGRYVCVARNPHCETCGLATICPSNHKK
jgi:endonuclease-3